MQIHTQHSAFVQ